jgi:hypothetical protein
MVMMMTSTLCVMILIRATEERLLRFFICPAARRAWNNDGNKPTVIGEGLEL